MRKANLKVLLTDSHVDMIYETLAKNVSMLTGKEFRANVGAVRIMRFEDFVQKHAEGKPIIALHTTINKWDLELVLLIDLDAGRRIAEILAGKANLELSEEIAIDALREFMNIVAGSYTSVMSKILGEGIPYEIPEVVVDIDTAIMTDLVLPTIVRSNSDTFLVHDVMITSSSDGISFRALVLGDIDA